ncbi:hypothetical protein A6X21_05080 [Planctopirus hydrillae]|uniref:Uncharacterized protein n=1 Tax=Planctopirus hydrillae TaxID=1841610 RepID=A0A1C3EIT2_9PLAN|nr:hypothetical protein A6X21_05080 [Planctopirus hydrillae]
MGSLPIVANRKVPLISMTFVVIWACLIDRVDCRRYQLTMAQIHVVNHEAPIVVHTTCRRDTSKYHFASVTVSLAIGEFNNLVVNLRRAAIDCPSPFGDYLRSKKF